MTTAHQPSLPDAVIHQRNRPLKQLRRARVISAGHAFIQNLRRGHYELGVEEPTTLRVTTAFDELALAI